MAKINVEFDTVEKTLDVKMDGESMSNVARVEFYSFDGEGKGYAEVVTREHDKDNSMMRTLVITANKVHENPPIIHSKLVAKRLGYN
jgi:hypothetical protein